MHTLGTKLKTSFQHILKLCQQLNILAVGYTVLHVSLATAVGHGILIFSLSLSTFSSIIPWISDPDL
jgi:hypothetical protein